VALGTGAAGALGVGVAVLDDGEGVALDAVVVWAVELADVVVEDCPSSLLEMGVQ
jgi:hypothetical protein